MKNDLRDHITAVHKKIKVGLFFLSLSFKQNIFILFRPLMTSHNTLRAYTHYMFLHTILNPRYVRVLKSLPWFGIEFYASKLTNIEISFYRNIVCQNI